MTSSARGLTTVELLVALTIGVAVIGAVLSLASPDAFAVQSEMSDMNQRLRGGADALFRDLVNASAIRPYRTGGSSPDAPGTFRSDTITALGAGISTYWLKREASTGLEQLMVYTGGVSLDVPVVDHVVGLRFDYLGDPQPPRMLAGLSDPGGLRVTYGPVPARDAMPPWAAGENCVFVANGTATPDPRLTVLEPSAQALVALDASIFADGPWCPDDRAPDRWDADLLRIRSVAVTLRVQSASAALRGPAGTLFARAGTSRALQRWAPDVEAHFTVAPRNLNLRK